MMSPQIFVALDVDEADRALAIAREVAQPGVGFKIGPRLLNRFGSRLISNLAQSGQVFVDCKFLDIPNTMESALAAVYDAGAHFATVHANCGSEAYSKIRKLETQFKDVHTLAVTVLTSYSNENLPFGWKGQSIESLVKGLVEEGMQAGQKWFVCSSHELAVLKPMGELKLVTPGIRFPEDDKGDQKRIMGPKEAATAGATALVVGRPIIDAANPALAAEKFLAEFRKGLL